MIFAERQYTDRVYSEERIKAERYVARNLPPNKEMIIDKDGDNLIKA